MNAFSLPPSHCLAFAMPVRLSLPSYDSDGTCLGFGLGFFFGHSFGNACKQSSNDGVKSLQSLSLRLMTQSTTKDTRNAGRFTQGL